ncbi:cell division protein FtsQ/DivIB [Roseicitreum antarcticum]|nr:cell division protein FtsQ/DivIB [Roseicitreum antarcticum]
MQEGGARPDTQRDTRPATRPVADNDGFTTPWSSDGYGVDDLRLDWQSGAAQADDLIPPAPAATFYDAHIQRLRGQTTPPASASVLPATSHAGGALSSTHLSSQSGAWDGAGNSAAGWPRDPAAGAPRTAAGQMHPNQAATRAAAVIAGEGRTQGTGYGAEYGPARSAEHGPEHGPEYGPEYGAPPAMPPAFLRRAPRMAGRDPAPSRLTYRLQRLWLTPLFRRVLGVGLPVAVIAFSVVTVLADPARHAALMAMYDDIYTAFQDRPEFRVADVEVHGASPEVAHAIRTQLGALLPESSLRLDLEAQRDWIEALDAIASAELRVMSGGTLEVGVTERVPAIIWRSASGLELLDRSGARVAMLRTRGGRPDLPVIAGRGASDHVPEALTLIATAGALSDRLRGLVRVGERRWDVVLDRDQRIMLPETGARAALERTLALHQTQDLLARDVTAVDLRTPARPTLRLAEGALNTLYSIRNQ